VSGGGKNFDAFAAGRPVKIVDSSPSLIEIATPSSVFINTCVINMATTHTHVPPYYLTSGTGGLQEALTNGPSKQGGANTVILNADWYTQVAPANPATVIASVKGNATLGLVDITTTPYTWYQWNGTQYVVINIGGGGIQSVFGRTGPNITAQAGDYNCNQVTGCGTQFGFVNAVGAIQGPTDTTLTLNTSTAIYPSSGTITVDTEYETYTGVNVGSNQLTGITRGVAATTAATHNIGAQVFSVNIPFSPLSQFPTGGAFGAGNGTTGPQVLAVNCGFPGADIGFNDSGALVVFQANCGSSATWIDGAGRIHQNALSNIKNFLSPIYIGNFAEDTGGGIGQPIPINNSTNVAQTTGAVQFGQPVGFTNGVVGPLVAKSVPNMPAPSLSGVTGGSCSITYEIVGTTADGETIPSATATIGSLTFPSTGIVNIQVPQIAGVVSYNAYRTAVSGCGGTVSIGKWTVPSTSQFPFFSDTGLAGDGSVPAGSNTSVAKSCVNGELFCQEAGPGTTPAFTCSTSTRGWEWHNTSATATPFAYVCNGTSFVTAF
jgi:hypothetical protein